MRWWSFPRVQLYGSIKTLGILTATALEHCRHAAVIINVPVAGLYLLLLCRTFSNWLWFSRNVVSIWQEFVVLLDKKSGDFNSREFVVATSVFREDILCSKQESPPIGGSAYRRNAVLLTSLSKSNSWIYRRLSNSRLSLASNSQP